MITSINSTEHLQIPPNRDKMEVVIEETISRIEERLRETECLSPAQRAELQELLARLRREADCLPTGALPADAGPESEDAQSAISRLEESLTALETSHPQLISLVNRISTMLANMGI
jgi:hypothetical protein